MPSILITDERFGGRFNGGLNGRNLCLPIGEHIEVDDDVLEHLNSLGVALSAASGADAEGSGVTSAPTSSDDLAKFDHDGDGKPGGSKPKAARKKAAAKKK